MPYARTVPLFVLLALVLEATIRAQPSQEPGEITVATATNLAPPSADERPLTGIRERGLGPTRPRHSFIEPSASVLWTWDSNGNFEYGSENATSLVGQIVLVRFIGRRGSLEYDGSVQYDSRKLQYEDQFSSSHQLRWSQQFTGRLWSFLLSDQALLTPSAAGGLMGMLGGASSEDLGIPVLQPSVVPDQSFLTKSSRRFINTGAAEVEYRESRRTSFTLSGANGIFRSIDNELLDGTQYNAIAGYNFAFTQRDTVGVSCGYETDQIDRTGVAVRSYSPGLNYAHRNAGRFMVEMSAYAQPYSITAPGLHRDRFAWGGNAGTQYRFSRNLLQVAINRGLSLGSGVLSGSRATWVSAGLGRPLSQGWQFQFNSMFARNSGLIGGSAYDTQYGGAALQRQLTRNAGIVVHYEAQHGFSNCTVSGCGPAMLQNVVSIGFNLTRSPIGIF